MERAQYCPETPSIADLLCEDDARVEVLFDCFHSAIDGKSPPAVRERLARRICEALSVQRVAEEKVLYPVIRVDDEKLVFAFLLAGHAITMCIAEIRNPAKRDSERDLAVLRLIAKVRRGMTERQLVLLPLLRESMMESQLRWLGAEYAQYKRLLRATVGAADELYDRLQDEEPVPESALATVPMHAWQEQRAAESSRPW